MSENGSRPVTLTTVYNELRNLRDEVTKLNVTAITVQDHEKRLRWVERLAWMAVGVAVVSSVLIPALMA